MIPGITGTLLSLDALTRTIPDALRGRLDEAGRELVRTRMRSWHEPPIRRHLGPAVTARGVYDRLAGPLMASFGYRVIPTSSNDQSFRALLDVDGRRAGVLLVTSWGEDLTAAWREAVRHGIGFEARWCVCVSGQFLRVMDTRRTYSRRFIEFDLHIAFDDARAFAVMWGLLRAAAMVEQSPPLLDVAVTLSETHRTAVRESLQAGVHDALTQLGGAFRRAHATRSRRRRHPNADLATTNESLVVVYRILFLLFAEARGLVPRWHPVYRDGYTIEALRGPVETLPRPRGLWEALQAIARLAHRGCHAGALRVPPFNGRLFSPAHAPLADSLPLDDGAVRQAVLALTTRPGPAGRERISYADLSVEQLGGVYERLLDFEPGAAGRKATSGRRDRRKSTGTFYTPRPLAEYLVRRTLAPLVHDATPEAILALRVLDPAMGSGAFLVAACRYLASAYEIALVRERGLSPSDVAETDRAGFRRVVAQRCLYGVDINPMAVQLARLSLWLATLAADRPLTFLDHRLRTGNSLVGATFADLARQPPPGRSVRVRRTTLPLFTDVLDAAIGRAVGVREAIATEPGDTLEQVRAKERALATLHGTGSMLDKWTRVFDLWCSGWFHTGSERAALRTAFASLVDAILTNHSALNADQVRRFSDQSHTIANRQHFFHWELEFPEVFSAPDGAPLAARGFDAVIGNPPWDTLRGDLGDAARRDESRESSARLSDFVRGSGAYAVKPDGQANLYQLFLERALAVTRPGGRLGLVLPSGFALDHGCGSLRRAVFNRTHVDTFIGIENRDGVFPIHRGLKFLVVSVTCGGRTPVLPCRFGVRRIDTLEQLPDVGPDPAAVPIATSLIERISGPELGVPELRTSRDLEIASQIALTIPRLEDGSGWHVHFGRELNVTDDRRHFTRGDGAPIIEGKHVQPFDVAVASARFRIPTDTLNRRPAVRRALTRARLAYRDVASPSNRLTLIAAIVPARVLTTHTLFCLKEDLDDDSLHVLCGLFNSFVANYLVRLRVGTHVTTAIVERLPVPRPARASPEFVEMCALSRTLHRAPTEHAAWLRLQSLAAMMYGVSRDQLQHILDTFPLFPPGERAAVLSGFAI